MKPAYYQSQNSGRDRWMISYLDVVTVLLILFVAIAAKSLQSAPTLEKGAPQPLAIASPVAILRPAGVLPSIAPPAIVPPAIGPPPSVPVTGLAAIKQALEQNHMGVQLEDVHLDSRGLVVSLSQALLFAPGEDRINADALATVSAIAQVLGTIPNNVSLVGHADATPIHNRRFGNNWELAAARGLRLLELLSSRYGIEESRLSVESYGSYDPKTTNATPDGRASNRRVEIVIRESVRPGKP